MFATNQRKAVLALVVAAFIFGSSFVVVKWALDDIEPLAFVGWRFLLGAVVLAVLKLPTGRLLWRDGLLAGIALFAGYSLQTAGLVFTSASNSALITGLYVVFTPLLVTFFTRRMPSPWVLSGTIGAFAGVVLLTGVDDLSFKTGDLLTLGCAVAFAVHIVILSRTSRHHQLVPFTTVQLLTTGVLALVASAMFEESPGFPEASVWPEILITALGVSVGAFLLQVWSQGQLGASTAAVILAGEPVFAVATAWLVLDEQLTSRGWLGAFLIVAAMYVVITRQRDEASLEAEAISPAH